MWLLDENLPLELIEVLSQLGIEADTTQNRKWRQLSNGMLVKAACESGFRVILTKDRKFAESAARALKLYPDMAVILIIIPQLKEKPYLENFLLNWKLLPIVPQAGKFISWP